VTTSTDRAPACRSALAAAVAVAPLVEGPFDVAPPLGEQKPALRARIPHPSEQRTQRELPGRGELRCEPLGRIVPAPQLPSWSGGDEDERGRVRGDERLADDRRSRLGEGAAATLLPGADEAHGHTFVGNGGARPSEGESPAGALPAAGDRPRDRRPAPGAKRLAKTNELPEAACAEAGPFTAAASAALGQEQVEEVQLA
jgi:hypothetical protein